MLAQFREILRVLAKIVVGPITNRRGGPLPRPDLLSSLPFNRLGPWGTLAQGIQHWLFRGPNLQQGSSMGKENYIWNPFLLEERSKFLTFL